MRRLLLIAVLLPGCQSPFDPASYVTGLRLLGVKAEPPEIAPGETATLTPLVVDTDGAPVTLDWASCLYAALPSESVSPHCILDDTGSFLTPLAAGPPVLVTMPNVSPEMLGAPDYTLGFYLPIRVRVHAGMSDLVGVYRLRYATGLVPRNHNPKLFGISAVAGPGLPDGGLESVTPLDDAHPLTLTAGDKLTLRATLDVNSWEILPVVSGDPRLGQFTTVPEAPRFLWYATAGSFSADVTKLEKPDTTLTLDKHLPTAGAGPTQVDLWVVVHDERGGTDFLHRTIHVHL